MIKRDTTDAEWAAEARAKEEKFGMYLTSLSKAQAAIQQAETRLASSTAGGDSVKDLVEGASDVLGPYLGAKVSGQVVEGNGQLNRSWVPRSKTRSLSAVN